MPQPADPVHDVERFVAQVRGRLNRQRAWRSVGVSLLFGALAMFAVAAAYVVRGHVVPTSTYVWIAALTAAGALVGWWCTRCTLDEASRFADGFYGLRDGITSWRGFRRAGRRGGMYELQAAQVASRLAALEPEQVPIRRAPGVVATGAALALAAGGLAFVGPSEAVLAEQALAERTREHTRQTADDLRDWLEELLEQAADDEKQLVDPDELRRWVDELNETDDLKEALRQYARIHEALREQSVRLSRELDEQLLTRAGEALERSEDTRELGEQLTDKRYDEAAEDLEKLEPRELSEDQRDALEREARERRERREADRQDEAQRERQRRDAERLRRIAQRMAAAARQAQRGQRPGPGRRGAAAGRGAGGVSGAAGGGAGRFGEHDDLAELLEALEEEVARYEQTLEDYHEWDGYDEDMLDDDRARLARHRDAARDRLRRLNRRLRDIDAARRMRDRLDQLRAMVGECESDLASRSEAFARGDQAGGPEAGEGTAAGENRDETPDDGQLTALRGQHGDGPSLTTVEAAPDGTGAGSRTAEQRDVAFRRQVESYVQREDVPEPVREGVRRYFESIHRGWEDAD